MSFVPSLLRVGSIILSSGIKTGSKYAVKSQSYNLSSKWYGKLSPLAKRSISNLGGNIVGSVLLSGLPLGKTYTKRTNIKKYYNNKIMPYGYRRSTYGRSYSRYPRYSRAPMYRRRSAYRSRRYY